MPSLVNVCNGLASPVDAACRMYCEMYKVIREVAAPVWHKFEFSVVQHAPQSFAQTAISSYVGGSDCFPQISSTSVEYSCEGKNADVDTGQTSGQRDIVKTYQLPRAQLANALKYLRAGCLKRSNQTTTNRSDASFYFQRRASCCRLRAIQRVLGTALHVQYCDASTLVLNDGLNQPSYYIQGYLSIKCLQRQKTVRRPTRCNAAVGLLVWSVQSKPLYFLLQLFPKR